MDKTGMGNGKCDNSPDRRVCIEESIRGDVRPEYAGAGACLRVSRQICTPDKLR